MDEKNFVFQDSNNLRMEAALLGKAATLLDALNEFASNIASTGIDNAVYTPGKITFYWGKKLVGEFQYGGRSGEEKWVYTRNQSSD